MRPLRNFLKLPTVNCALWIAVCFSLTSGVWISWEYHMMPMLAPAVSDLYTMVIGYCLQAAGVGLGVYGLHRQPDARRNPYFLWTIGLFLLIALPALLSEPAIIVVLCGLLMNFLCGVIAAFYLMTAAVQTEHGRRGLVFGCGYGLSTVFIFLLSLLDEGNFLRARAVLIVYLLLAASAVWMVLRAPLLAPAPDKRHSEPPARAGRPTTLLALALITVFLLSLVKNLGFSFPADDIQTGLRVELSRIFYAAGLVLAGVISDKSRKYGAICTAAALAIPFVMLSMHGEAVPSLISWSLEYLFFGFFSVFRAVLFLDMAAQSGQWHWAPLGLLSGRLGDAAGTALCLALASSRILLIALTLSLFILTMLLFFHLYQALYVPEAMQERSEREIFEGFSIQHDLSTREKEVLRLVLAEQSNTQIAEALFVSESTIKYHVHNLLQKTGCKSRQELVKKYHMVLYPQIAKK